VSSQNGLPFMSASALNGIRRTLAEMLESTAVRMRPLLNRRLGTVTPLTFPSDKATYRQNISNRLSEESYRNAGVTSIGKAYELTHEPDAELMRTRYCIRYELGMCPVHQGAKNSGPLFLLNNGRRLSLHFDCRNCEMTVKG